MPRSWRVLMIVMTVALVASVVVGTIQMNRATTTVFGSRFEGLPKTTFPDGARGSLQQDRVVRVPGGALS